MMEFSWRKITPKQWALAGVAVLALIGLALLYRQIDVQALHDQAAKMNAFWVFIATTLLPMVGFPVSVLHVVVGVRFGTGLGLALTSVSILIQLVMSYWLVKMAPGFFGRWVEPLRKRLPKTTHTAVTQFTMLLPGAPYFAQNYVLPLIGVPLGTYMVWGFLLHLVRSIVGVIFGHESATLTPWKIAGFAVYAVTISLLCAWALRRLQRQMKDQQPAEGDPTPLA